jgi:hypothetical protein
VSDCPSRPCEIATACTSGQCTYEPVTCDFERCETCEGECDDAELRGCGTGCAASFCDPSPVVVGGRVEYANACVAREHATCGTCGLGSYACESGADVCRSLEIAGVDPDFVECDGSAASATVLFVDPTYSGIDAPDGRRERPFRTMVEALAAAAVRGSRAIVIGGRPTFDGSLAITNGLSIYGGFSPAPDFVPDARYRPVFRAAFDVSRPGALVGVRADGIDAPTELSGVDVVTDDIASPSPGAGASNIGIYARNSSGLVLRRVNVRAGAGQPGARGADALLPTGVVHGGSPGTDGSVVSRTCSAPNGVPGGAGAMPSVCNGVLDPSTAGGAGARTNEPSGYDTGATSPGGALGGTASYGTTCIYGPGQNGAYLGRAADGIAGVSVVSWYDDVPQAIGYGASGTHGRNGIGGGGGGSASAYELWDGSRVSCRRGGSGGGGGSGGCGGLGGSAGAPGGFSLGLVIVGSAPSIDGLEIVVSNGGAGGGGGLGSSGTPGGGGAAGGLPATSMRHACGHYGSAGGTGGPGQHGGHGGAGANGRGVGVLCAPGTRTTLDRVTASGSADFVLQMDCS